MPAALDVDVTAAEEDVDGLADAVEQVAGRGVDGADAFEFGADEEGTFAVQGLGVVALTLLLRAGDGPARLKEVKAGGAGLLGHQRTSRPKVLQRFDVLLRESKAEPRKLLQDMVQYRIARDA